jgi:hypothetical protein
MEDGEMGRQRRRGCEPMEMERWMRPLSMTERISF